MKIQDLLFIIILCVLIFMRNGRMTARVGIVCILLSMPLFALKTSLFTAERLTMYAAGIMVLTFTQLSSNKKSKFKMSCKAGSRFAGQNDR